MIINQWTVLVLAICYFCSYQAKGDVQTNNVNKLDFWQREPKVNDTRRLQKKQTRSEKYPRRFQAVHYGNELHEIASSDQDNTEELSTAKNESRSEKNSKNLIVQEYGKEDKFKKKKQKASKDSESTEPAVSNTKRQHTIIPVRRWFNRMPGVVLNGKKKKVKDQGEYKIHNMFNKKYLLRNRLRDRNKIVIRS